MGVDPFPPISGPDGSRRRFRTDRGQATPVVVLVVLVAGGALLLVTTLARATLDRAGARTAADAAALAGAADGSGAARDLASANDGRVVEVIEDGPGLRVTVAVGDAVAEARAVRAPPVGDGATGRQGLAPAMLAAIDRAERLLGRPITVVSGFRSRREQERLWAARATNPFPVAPPGTSRHETGYAIDVPLAEAAAIRRIAPAVGLCLPLPVSDPVHFELCRWTPT